MHLTSKILTQRFVSLLLSVYVGLLLNSACLARNAAAGNWLAIVSALISAIAMVAFCYGLFSFFSLFGKKIYKLLSVVVLLISASASFYMTFFNVVIGYGIVVSALTFDIDLTKEVFGYPLVLWTILTGILPSAWLCFCPIRKNIYVNHETAARRLLYRGLPAFITLFILVVSLDSLIYLTKQQGKKNNQYVASPAGIIAHSYLPTNWIAGVSVYLHQVITERNTAERLFNPAKHFTYQPKQSLDDLFVVFVIGETTRWDHMGMLGYSRDTTPLLAQEPNLVAMAGVSCDTATKLSLRCMFVREGGTDENSQRALKENNVFFVLRKLGFTSELFGMQSEVWFYSSVGANSYEIREELASEYAQTQRPINDMLLVSRLEKSLKKYPQGKHLVILHTKGSHYLYSQRYPQEFAQFQPECMSINTTCSKQQLINSFDNSVLFVDHMLKNVFDQLRDKNAIVFYASDHGESIDDDYHFHASPKEVAPEDQFRIPIMVWASDKFLSHAENKKAFTQLKAYKNSGATPHHEQIYDSFLGCLGYTSPNGGINQKNNWCH